MSKTHRVTTRYKISRMLTIAHVKVHAMWCYKIFPITVIAIAAALLEWMIVASLTKSTPITPHDRAE